MESRFYKLWLPQKPPPRIILMAFTNYICKNFGIVMVCYGKKYIYEKKKKTDADIPGIRF